MTKAEISKSHSEAAKRYWATRKEKEKLENVQEIGEATSKTVTIDKTLAGVVMHLHAREGRLKVIQLKFTGGSEMCFTVEE